MNDASRPISQQNASRIRIPGALAEAVGWSTSTERFECHGFFRSKGELLCAAVDAQTEDGTHPFAAVLNAGAKIPGKAEFAASLDELGNANLVAMPFRLMKFVAAWTDKNRTQLDLKLGTTFTGMLGWTNNRRPAIYPIPLPQILCLLSQEKLDAIHDTGLIGFDAE